MRESAVAEKQTTDAASLAELTGPVSAALAAGDTNEVMRLAGELRAPDLADLIELLTPENRLRLIQALGSAFDYEALGELDPSVRDEISEALPNDVLAKAASELDTDDAAYVLESLDDADKTDVLAQMPEGDRAALERNLDYPEETAGRLMQAEFVAVAPFWTVGRVIDHMRETEDLPESFQEIYVVDPAFKVLGVVDLSRLLRTKRLVLISDIMETDHEVVVATTDQDQLAYQFERYGLMAAPVVDANQRLVGVVTVDDVVEVIEQEADKEIKALGGVGDERFSDSVRQIAPSRFWWLSINLLTAILASAVIQVFDATIEQMVALAVLMPIVASMGGNAGTQTMTVAVRALATKDLSTANTTRFALRESAVGLLNGAAFAIIMALVVFFWFGSGKLGLVIGAAMIINLFAAAIAGIFIPIALDRMKFDPAVSSTVFVTTVTDVIGFFAFLGLASLIMR